MSIQNVGVGLRGELRFGFKLFASWNIKFLRKQGLYAPTWIPFKTIWQTCLVGLQCMLKVSVCSVAFTHQQESRRDYLRLLLSTFISVASRHGHACSQMHINTHSLSHMDIHKLCLHFLQPLLFYKWSCFLCFVDQWKHTIQIQKQEVKACNRTGCTKPGSPWQSSVTDLLLG